MNRLSEEAKEKMLSMWKSGVTLDSIASEFGVRKTTVYYWTKDVELPKEILDLKRRKHTNDAWVTRRKNGFKKKPREEKKSVIGFRDRFDNSRDMGDSGVGIAISWFTLRKYKVSIPLTDCQEYDILVDDSSDREIYKVQIKTTSSIDKYGFYIVSLSHSWSNSSGSKRKKCDLSLIDYIFVVTDSNELYLIPTKDLNNIQSFYLSHKYDKYKVEML